MASNQIPEMFFFKLPKKSLQLEAVVTGHFEIQQNKAQVCELHFNLSDINISVGEGKKYLKRSTVARFHEIEGPVCARRNNPCN